MFKKIEDERLKLENLKNIRIIAIVQTLLLTGLWVYEAFIQGQGTSGTPLTFILLITGILSGLLSMRVSIANENKPPKAKSILIPIP
ncbi:MULTISPECIES: hypothetical protein [Bacillaceae]|uniref:ATP synthase protein I n=1 Tax=Evansella alkalicola TaxID=745819 RepID=A0ABS6JZZ5_9BACI|nr:MULTISPECIES: hypothetical protein [Bacillaceae]MBU9722787.1 hypothetical protein [Bacillus alkalicola]